MPKNFRICWRMNGLKVRRAADQLPRATPFALEQHRHDLAHAGRIERCLVAGEHGLEPMQPANLYRLRHLVPERRPRGPGRGLY